MSTHETIIVNVDGDSPDGTAGVFLGTVFLHLLPHLAGVEGEGHAAAAGTGPSLAPWIAALLGLLLLFAIEKVWLSPHPTDTGPLGLMLPPVPALAVIVKFARALKLAAIV